MSLTKRLMALVVIIGLPLLAQEGAEVNQSEGPPVKPWTTLYFYDGSSNLEYACAAKTNQDSVALSVTQIVDSSTTGTVTTSAAHGLAVGNVVVVAGVTGDTDLNGTYVIQTVPSTTTFTITTASVTDATYNNAGITATTTAPRTTRPIWAIQKFSYSGTSLVRKQWAVKSTIGGTAAGNICDNRATLGYN